MTDKVSIQVVFYSMCGHVYRMAEAIAEGARAVAGTEVGLFQVPELVSTQRPRSMGARKRRSRASILPCCTGENIPASATGSGISA